MSVQLNTLRNRYDSITISTIQVATVLSLLLHALLLWSWRMDPPLLPLDESLPGEPNRTLAVRLAPPPAPPPARASPAQPALSAPSPGPAVHRSPPPPRRLAIERPSPSATPQPVETMQPPVLGDFASFVDARRRAREPAPPSAPSVPSKPAETDQERDNRLVAERLGLDRLPTFGAEPDRGGGIFEMARVGLNDAEFFFYGWNKDIKRISKQMIPVRRGDNPTIEIAVVRRMIVLIRELTSQDFRWNSRRLGRVVNLSARLDDNAGLEDFLMQEFFSKGRR